MCDCVLVAYAKQIINGVRLVNGIFPTTHPGEEDPNSKALGDTGESHRNSSTNASTNTNASSNISAALAAPTAAGRGREGEGGSLLHGKE